MDTFAFASLAHVRVLLVPVGAISQTTFERHTAEIRSFETIRLGDIPADVKDDRARFMPSPLSTGHILLSFPTHPPPHSHLPLSLFRLSHFPLAVIGIAVCSRDESLAPVHAQFNESLIDVFPPGSVFPLAKSCFVYDESDEGNLSVADNPSGLVIIPNAMGNKKLYIGTLLAGLCSNVLEELSVLVQTLESPIGNEYLNSSLLPLMPTQSELPSRLSGAISSDRDNQDLARSSFMLNAAPPGRRNSAGSGFRQPTLITTAPKKRLSTIGVASSHGRLYKVLGDLFLLVGRVDDASVWYTEALQLLKNSQDFTWHASILEGMVTVSVVEAWTAGQGLQNSLPSSKEPWTDTSEKLFQAASLYQKSAIIEGEQSCALLSFIYTSCILRHASLFFSIWSAKGWGPLAFTTMLQPGPAPYLPPTLSHEESMSWSNLERLSSLSGVPRSFISSIIAQGHGPWLLHLAPRERISALEIMASLYACLGYRRKEVYVLREILGCIMDLIVCGREEDGLTRPTGVTGATGFGIQGHPQAMTSEGAMGVRFSESIDGNESILRLSKYVCMILGVNLEAVKMVDTDGELDQDKQMDIPETDVDADDYHEPYGWPELQVGVVREAVAVAEALPDFPAVAQFAAASLKTLRPNLTSADQFHLHSTSARALSTAHRRGDQRKIEYWLGQPILSITIAQLPLIRMPVEKPISALQPRISDITPILTGAADPFLYNPRKAAVGERKLLVVQNETLEFSVTLQNPYVFDLEIQSISLSTSGVEFHSQPARITIPGNSIHQVTISGKPLATGLLLVRGCFVQAPGGALREFVLPLLTSQEEEKLARRKSNIACETGRWKYSGLECFPWTKTIKRDSGSAHASRRVTPRFLECQVVPELPLLRIRRTSVTHGAVMLYEGEKKPIRITIENVSHLPIDFVRLVFNDSTIGPAQQSLAGGDLSVFNTYETEYNLLQKPVLSWSKDENIIVPPGRSHTLTVQCYGKAGCTKGTVHVTYAYAHRPESKMTSVFHTRQLSYSMAVTVYQMLDCYGMDILPFPSYSTAKTGADENLLVSDSAWCLFSIEVRNTYGSPFDVTLERAQEGIDSSFTKVTVPPGSTTKLLIPLRKFSLPLALVSKPVPTLSDRQFVVAKSGLSTSDEQLQRELFWYREELFKIICGRWCESGGVRSGELSLRNQKMTLSMLEAIRMEAVHVQLTLMISEGERIIHPEPNTFVCLRATVKNLSAFSDVFVLDFKLEPSEDILYEGVIQDMPIGRLDPGASKEIDTTVCFLACGYFEILAEVRLVGADKLSRAGIGHLKVTLPGENR
ncbi:hypothetical protein AX15_003936 [Amanita polypyramis BW_CC]|nr:hypothetical protein AX15_003936 [Amanita polypyramis BW_CC]